MSVNTAVLLFKLKQIVNPCFLQSGGKKAVYLKLKEMTAEFENDAEFLKGLACEVDSLAVSENIKTELKQMFFEKEPYFRAKILADQKSADSKKLQSFAKNLFLKFKKEIPDNDIRK